jgi:hypothetical protein
MYKKGFSPAGVKTGPAPSTVRKLVVEFLKHVTPSDRGALFQYHWDVC